VTTQTPTPARVVLFGLGALGSLVIDCLKANYPLIQVAGAVDHDPAKSGKTLGELYPGLRNGADVVVAPSLQACLARLGTRPDLVYHMTESELDRIEPQLVEALSAGVNVISASEAMYHPALRYRAVAERLDQAARAEHASITGVGINPGFSFDALPLMLGRVTSAVRAVRITRTIDVTGTGPGDIDHVGYGLWPDEFNAGIASGRIAGHMGMPESIATIAERLGIDIDAVDERWETSTATFPVDSGTAALGVLEPGRVIGIAQEGRGRRGDATVISMRLVMFYQPERHGLTVADEIDIEGAHHVRASLRPAALSLFGAANAIVNATHDVIAAPPGLVNVLDFSIAGVRRGGFRYVRDDARAARPGYLPVKRVGA
jgi:4-hydroxy-tetrahydrodipicolinate reductase